MTSPFAAETWCCSYVTGQEQYLISEGEGQRKLEEHPRPVLKVCGYPNWMVKKGQRTAEGGERNQGD